jgi:3-deoxy-D-manno-octulosonic-acid transferase
VSLMYRAYNVLSSGLFLTFFPPFWMYSRLSGRHREGMSQRLGYYPGRLVKRLAGFPRIWIHAASVGEVRVAEAIISSLYRLIPGCRIVVSTVTEQGQARARETLGPKATCVYAPLDFIPCTRRALRTLKPHALVCLETELWPNWLIGAHRMGVKTAIVNGRISVRSMGAYLKVRSLMQETLGHIDAFSMKSEADANRIVRIGASARRVQVNGNAKYDLLMQGVDIRAKAEMADLFHIKADTPVFVVGSIRGSEEKIIVDVFRKVLQSFPDTLLILAPRHLNRASNIRDLVRSRGLTCQYRSELTSDRPSRRAQVVILDTTGELKHVYGVADVVFCGGSLMPLGGQNILEAAVWGKPVMYGPYMEDFLDAKELLDEFGGGVQVPDGAELAEKVVYYLGNPDEAQQLGERAKRAVASHLGAADKHAAIVQRLLD